MNYKNLSDTMTLNNGVNIPCIGFGTWQVENGDTAYQAVREAIAAGYRHIDTASGYGNEESVGRAVRDSGVPRDELFITSKLPNNMHGYEETMESFEQTMKNLGLDVLDLYLIHWPAPVKYRDNWEAVNAETWRAFEELYRAGRIRSIGLSNFMPHHIEALLKTATIKPMVNQIKLCPGETQNKVVEVSRRHDILLEAYSPLGTGKIFSVEAMQDLAAKYNKSIAQIALRWSLQRGYLPLPKSVTPERIRANGDVFDFELNDADMDLITNLTGCCGEAADPDKVPF